MKLLFVCTNHAGGGLETSFVILAKAMQMAGHEVVALVRKDSHIDRLLGDGVAKYYGIFKGAADPRGVRALSRVIKNFQPDWMVSAFSKEYWPVTILGLFNDVKVALFKHTESVLQKGSRRLLPRLADRFIVISQHMREYYIQQGIPPERIQLLLNPFDFSRYQFSQSDRERLRQQSGITEKNFVVGYIGAMNYHKGIYELAEALNRAMQQNNNIHAVWIGSGDEKNLSRIFQQGSHPENHHLLGWANDVVPYYSMLDTLALPTVSTETFGRVCVEAAAMGVPSLGSRLGGIPEAIMEGVTGELLPAGDVEAWSASILKLSSNSAYREKLAEAGPAFARKHFSAEIIASQFERILLGE